MTTAREQLDRRLEALDAAGAPPPCTGSDDWIDERHNVRAKAAARCRGCPVLELCAAAGEETDEQFGVWGGRDRTPGRRQRRNP